MPTEIMSDRFTFNAYDLFSNLLPGVVLVFGVTLPFFGPGQLLPNLNLITVLITTTLAFAAGIGIQSVGSMLSDRVVFGLWPWSERERPFNEKMDNMLISDARGADHSKIEWAARELCIEVFNLNCDGDDDTEHIFKSMLAYLESSKWSRGLRIQSLHLASRGLYVSLLLLFVYYALFSIGILFDWGTPIFIYQGQFSPTQFGILSLVTFPISLILFRRARHFEDDVVVYILAEFFMSFVKWDELNLKDITQKDS